MLLGGNQRKSFGDKWKVPCKWGNGREREVQMRWGEVLGGDDSGGEKQEFGEEQNWKGEMLWNKNSLGTVALPVHLTSRTGDSSSTTLPAPDDEQQMLLAASDPGLMALGVQVWSVAPRSTLVVMWWHHCIITPLPIASGVLRFAANSSQGSVGGPFCCQTTWSSAHQTTARVGNLGSVPRYRVQS